MLYEVLGLVILPLIAHREDHEETKQKMFYMHRTILEGASYHMVEQTLANINRGIALSIGLAVKKA